MLEYQLGTSNSPYDFILNDQWASDWSYVNSQEAFFAHQSYSAEPQTAGDLASGRVGNSTGLDQADIANPAWQQYTINSVLQNIAATGANGWFADSFTYGFGGAGYSGTIPVRYQGTNAINAADWPGGVTWDQQLGNWVNTIESAFASYNASNGTSLKFIPNLDNLTTSWMPTAWYQNVDGAFLESFGDVGAGYDDPSPSDWVLEMNRGLTLSGANKIVIMQPYLDNSNPDSAAAIQQREYLLGTYLLLQGQYTYLNISAGGVDPYYFPEYQLNLGTASTALPTNISSDLWNGVYRRNFQNGFVLVNPNDSSYTLNLGGTYQLATPSGGGVLTDADLDANGNYIGGSLSYQSMSSITLGPGSAAIFVNAATTTTLTDNGISAATAGGSIETGYPIGFTVTVAGATTPTGTVQLEDAANGNALVGTAQTLVNGTVTFTVAATAADNLGVGTHQLVAVYIPTGTFAVSQSNPVGQVIDAVFKVQTLGTTATSNFLPTATGFQVTFNAIVDPSDLFAWGTAATASIRLQTGSTVVAGSVVFDAATTQATFVATGNPSSTGGNPAAGILTPGATYTPTLSGTNSNPFEDTLGHVLGSSTASGGVDYTTPFTSPTSATATTVSVPYFTRGYSQAVNVLIPGNSAGIPVIVSVPAGGAALTSATFDVFYNPALLTISAGSITAAGFTGTVTVPSAGQAHISLSGGTLAVGTTTVVASLTASVPASAPFKDKEILDLRNIDLNGGTNNGQDGSAVHVVAFVADTDFSRSYSSQDAFTASSLSTAISECCKPLCTNGLVNLSVSLERLDAVTSCRWRSALRRDLPPTNWPTRW
jgi:hypothetical protein